MSIQPRCEECGARFEMLRGGICAECGRMLCGSHLHGILAQFLAVFSREAPRCRRCRRTKASAVRGE